MCLYVFDGKAVVIHVCAVYACDNVRFKKKIKSLRWQFSVPMKLLLCLRRPCCGRLLHTEGKVVSAVAWRCSIDLERLCRIVFQLNKPEFSAKFRHSFSLAWVCLFAAGGGGAICEIIGIQTAWFCIPLVSEQMETYLMGIFSQCVFGLLSPSLRWCIGSLISVLGRSATFSW